MLLCNRFATICLVVSFSSAFGIAQPVSDGCPRPKIGAIASSPAELRSSGGKLNVELSFRTSVDVYGSRLYCYVYDGRAEAPTLRVSPGDEVVLKLRNQLSIPAGEEAHAHSMEIQGPCGGGRLTASSTNLHFHGMHLAPVCHQDEVISTLVQPSADGYEYRFRVPHDQPPGLYWYHPHPHGHSEAQVLGGASGALIVESIERAAPKVAGLAERVLVLRDQPVPGMVDMAEDAGPGKDISINSVAVMFPLFRPASLPVRPGQREFWRVLNAAADTYFDLQVRFGPDIQDVLEPQPIELVAIDGVPIGGGEDCHRIDVLLPPGSRAEFITAMPPLGKLAQLVMLKYDTGPDGAATPYRALANIVPTPDAPGPVSILADPQGTPKRFAGLTGLKPAQERKLYFSEEHPDPKDKSRDSYFITVQGETPKVFDMNFKRPDIVARQGTVEDWTVENRTKEAHAFHIHQTHFQVIERDGQPVAEKELRDTVDLPFWDGASKRYPSVKVRIDFRSPEIVGTFLYHCHILEHEDKGMMGAIRVERAVPTGN